MASTNRLHVGDRAASLHTESCGTTKAGCDVVPRELSKGALVALSRVDWVTQTTQARFESWLPFTRKN